VTDLDPGDALDPGDSLDPSDTLDPGGGSGPGARHRVLVAKVGLDGHDRGVKVVGRILRDAGFEVIYTGLQQTPEMVVAAARDEDVELIGLSLHSGAHMTLVPRLLDSLRGQGLDIPVVIGGIIPVADGTSLRELGVAAVLTPGASSDEIIVAVTQAIKDHANLR
jgi:methylmalonyl-CoA mutase C-terminal domain/subunit